MLDLVAAFNEARLCALHVDLQETFYHETPRRSKLPTAIAFDPVNQLAKKLRQFGVPNHWIAMAHEWKKSSFAEFTNDVRLNHNHAGVHRLGIHPLIDVDDDELVFQKEDLGAFRRKSCLLTEHLQEAGHDTIIIDGVYYDECLTDTIATGLKAGFKFYVVLDATNCPAEYFDEFVSWFNAGSTEEEKMLVTFTTTLEIEETLKTAKQAQAIAATKTVDFMDNQRLAL